jgi:hypothetical protein
MQKKILNPSECSQLIPHWYDINPEKISKIDHAITRMSRFGYGERREVMSVPAILISDDNYILNGRHRAYLAAKRGYSLETCIVSSPKEIAFHTPKETIADLSIEELIESFNKRNTYISICNNKGIYSIKDLIKIY